jgi:hypothetical protein
MRAPGWYLTPPYTRTALCRQCGYALRELLSPCCPECATAFDPDDPRTMHIPGWKPPRERLDASFGATMITLAAGGTLITAGSAYDVNVIMSLYGLALWLGVPIAWLRRTRAKRQARRAGTTLAGTPEGPRWRLVVASLLLLTILWGVSYDRCPHARYIGWGAVPVVIQGRACNNQRYLRPVLSLLWDK